MLSVIDLATMQVSGSVPVGRVAVAVVGGVPLDVSLSSSLLALCLGGLALAASSASANSRIAVLGTVVTMDGPGTVLQDGGVLIDGNSIAATWAGNNTPAEFADAVTIDLGPDTFIFPGLINLHDHPTWNFLETWPAPSSHKQNALGRPLGTEPYANRYEWNTMRGYASPEYLRLVDNPHTLINRLGLDGIAVIYGEVKAVLGGETTTHGWTPEAARQVLIRNAEHEDFFGPKRVRGQIKAIGETSSSVKCDMQKGAIDAWLVHLAEGVRDDDRPENDPVSSRADFDTLKKMGLLTDMTVIVHGTGLEPPDFVAMRAATTIRNDDVGDGLGAKLVWSPLSNLFLYGKTALVYHALKAGVLVSLGTDWSPSGSRTLLDELKIADRALRDGRLLGGDRNLVPTLDPARKAPVQRIAAERALDQALVRMVTTNPARTLRWDGVLGSVEVGKRADLIVIRSPDPTEPEKVVVDSPYRRLIDATEQDVRLVLVDGNPIAGDTAPMQVLKPGDYELVTSPAGCFQKAIDVTVPGNSMRLAAIKWALAGALQALGGDHPPPGGGPSDNTNTYSALKELLGNTQIDADFRDTLGNFFGETPEGRLNLEAVRLAPVLIEDDDFYFHLLCADVSSNGLIADATPPFGLYRTNLNHVQKSGNPFDAASYRNPSYDFCSDFAQIVPLASAATGQSIGLATRFDPASGTSHLMLDVPQNDVVRMSFYDVCGALVRTLAVRSFAAGRHDLVWDLEDSKGVRVRPGLYWAEATTPGARAVARIVVLR